MGFLIFNRPCGDAVPDGKTHLYRRAGNGYAGGIAGNGLVRDALRRLSLKEYGRSKKAKEEQKRLPEFWIFHEVDIRDDELYNFE